LLEMLEGDSKALGMVRNCWWSLSAVSIQIGETEGALDATHLEGFFRGSLLKLQFSEARLKPLPAGELDRKPHNRIWSLR